MKNRQGVLRAVSCVVASTVLTSLSFGQAKKLYVWPANQHPNTVLNPTPPITDVVDVSRGWKFGVLIRGDLANLGRLVGWGANEFGQTGTIPRDQNGDPIYPAGTPCATGVGVCKAPPIELSQGTLKPRRVSATWMHVLALTDNPAYQSTRGLLAWGRNDDGQCDIPNFNGAPWFVDGVGNPPPPPTAKIADIAAGEHINIVLFDNGKIAAWGERAWGVSPVGPIPSPHTEDWYEFPYTFVYARQNDAVNPWRFTKIAAGGHFVMALGFLGNFADPPTNLVPIEGEVLTWGAFDYGVGGGVNFGPRYRYGDERNAPGPFPKGVCAGMPQNQIYMPPYIAIGANHQSCWGVTATEELHGWANPVGGAHQIPSNSGCQQVTGGYDSWGFAKLRDSAGKLRLQSWGNVNLNNNPNNYPCPAGREGIPTGAPNAEVEFYFRLAAGNSNDGVQYATCQSANCDGVGGLTANDYLCFTTKYAEASLLSNDLQIMHYANFDGSTGNPALTANDFTQFSFLFLYQDTSEMGMGIPCP